MFWIFNENYHFKSFIGNEIGERKGKEKEWTFLMFFFVSKSMKFFIVFVHFKIEKIIGEKLADFWGLFGKINDNLLLFFVIVLKCY